MLHGLNKCSWKIITANGNAGASSYLHFMRDEAAAIIRSLMMPSQARKMYHAVLRQGCIACICLVPSYIDNYPEHVTYSISSIVPCLH